MSHWAELDSNNKVIRVTVGDNNEPDEGYQWLINNLGGTWVKTSYNNKIRKRYAGIGMTYREDLDAFITPQCHDEAILNQESTEWECSNAEHNPRIS
jgi:hypothetical protein